MLCVEKGQDDLFGADKENFSCIAEKDERNKGTAFA